MRGKNTSGNNLNHLLADITSELSNSILKAEKIDGRIIKCIKYIKNSDGDNLKLKELAELVHLSESRTYHLVRDVTGITVRQFILHCKLIRSLKSICNEENFTEASFSGGFSDQPHFNKTFKKTFGVIPSLIKE